MKNYWVILVLTILLITACKQKKEETKEAPISAISIIKGQLHNLDSFMYEIKKVERNENRNDTTFINRHEARSLAAPFLSLPDIADKKLSKKYTEERLLDAEQNILSITSTLKEDEHEEIEKQMLGVDISDISNGHVQSIFIDTYKQAGDSTIETKLVWEVDKYFTIYTTIQKSDQPEKNYFIKVMWQ